MKVTVFTSNQPRHTALIESLAGIATEVFAVQECNTVFPGGVADFSKKTDVMRRYFTEVIRAETEVFGRPRFTPANVRVMPVRMGDLNLLTPAELAPALDADVYVIFGASYIKGALCDFLVERGAYNIHMGVSPYFRGSACNFWALFDGRADCVGATIHLLSKGLDSGEMLFHALPKPQTTDAFTIGMRAVKTAHEALTKYLRTGELAAMPPAPQDKTRQIRYSRIADFNDAVASEYLDREPTPVQIARSLEQRDLGLFLRPYVG